MLEQVKGRTSPLGDAIKVENERVTVVREADLASPKMDALVRQANEEMRSSPSPIDSIRIMPSR